MISPNSEPLLRQLAAYREPFDAGKIHGWAQDDEALFEALRFLRVRPNKQDERVGLRRLNEITLKRIRQWFDQIERKNVAGLCLTRDEYGWCSIVKVE